MQRFAEQTLMLLTTVAGVLWRVRRRIAVTIAEIIGIFVTLIGVALWSGRASIVLLGLILSFAAYRWDRAD